MKKLLVGLLILLLLAGGMGGGWYYVSPRWTLREMQKAANERNAAALSAYIDYPALRASLKSELAADLSHRAQGERTGLGSLAATVGGLLVGPAVDALITPSALTRSFATDTLVDEGDDGLPRPVRLGRDPVITREGLSEFRVAPRGRPGGLIFRRDGLGWKLCGVDLPPSGPDDGAGTGGTGDSI